MRIDGKGTPVARPKYWAIGWNNLFVVIPTAVTHTRVSSILPNLGELDGEVAEENELRTIPLLLRCGDFLLQRSSAVCGYSTVERLSDVRDVHSVAYIC